MVGNLFLPKRSSGQQASLLLRLHAGSRREADRAGRVIVGADLTLPLHPEIFVIGDTAAVTGEDGRMIPGIAPAAKQEGQYVAKLIQSRLKDENLT